MRCAIQLVSFLAFWAGCMTRAEPVLWREVEQDGTAKFPVTIYSNVRAISKKHYYGKAERDESFFLWMRSQLKDDIRKAWEKSEENIEN